MRSLKRVALLGLFSLGVTAALSSDAGAEVSEVCGDVNNSGSVTSSDALNVLKKAVGQSASLICPPLGKTLKTGLTVCYDPVSNSPIFNPEQCPDMGQDGELELGLAREFSDRSTGTIRDLKTGLMWEVLDDNNVGGISVVHDRDTLYTWSQAFQKIADLNTIKFAGHDDWRLPNIRELDSIVYFEGGAQSHYSIFISGCAPGCTLDECSCASGAGYWSSTSLSPSASNAWVVEMNGARTTRAKSTPSAVRAVRNY